MLLKPSGTPERFDQKRGKVLPISFSGNPKKAVVTFTDGNYPDTNYVITLSAIGVGYSFDPSPENQTVSGFTINLNCNTLAGLQEVGWATSDI